MYILGMVLLIIGAVLFFGSRITSFIYEKRNKRETETPIDEDYLVLMNNVILAVKSIGAVFVIIGGILLIFVK